MLADLLRKLDLNVNSMTIPLLERVVDELLRWNPRRNLTAITDRDEVLEKQGKLAINLYVRAEQYDESGAMSFDVAYRGWEESSQNLKSSMDELFKVLGAS